MKYKLTHSFEQILIEMFREIMDKWLDAILDDSSRLKSLNTLEGLPNKQFSLFGKFETG